MAAGANSDRNKALDDRKRRAAGRTSDRGPERQAIADFQGKSSAQTRGTIAGASGKEGKANRKSASVLEGGGGGGAAPSDKADVGESRRKNR